MNVMGVGDIISKPNVVTASSMHHQCVILRHKYEQSPGVAVSVRPAPAKSSLAEISVLAAYYWTIPLEELKLYGFFQGEKVSLEHERDWQGYYSVCSSVRDKIIIDVYREKMGGINRCSSEVDCRTIWGPLANLHLGPPRAALPGYTFSSNGTAPANNVNLSTPSDPFVLKHPATYFAPKSLGVIGGTSDKGGASQSNIQHQS